MFCAIHTLIFAGGIMPLAATIRPNVGNDIVYRGENTIIPCKRQLKTEWKGFLEQSKEGRPDIRAAFFK